MFKKILVFVVVCFFVFPLGLLAKDNKGADLLVETLAGKQVRGELIAAKDSSLLLLERESGADVSGDIENTEASKKFQLSFDTNPIYLWEFSWAISFALRTSERWYWGLRIGYIQEDNRNTFDSIEFVDEVHADIFRRYYPSDYFYVDFGGSILTHSSYYYNSEVGYFIGAYSSISIGYKYIFLSPAIRLGYASLEGFGVIFSPAIIKIQFQF